MKRTYPITGPFKKTSTDEYFLMVGNPCSGCRIPFAENEIVYRREVELGPDRGDAIDFLCERCYFTFRDPRAQEPRRHVLKIWPAQFDMVRFGAKRHEVRVNDREFKTGDLLILAEYDPALKKHTHRNLLVRVTHITQGGTFGLPEDLCVLSIAGAGAIFYWTAGQISAWVRYKQSPKRKGGHDESARKTG